jgi:hypothetical protein
MAKVNLDPAASDLYRPLHNAPFNPPKERTAAQEQDAHADAPGQRPDDVKVASDKLIGANAKKKSDLDVPDVQGGESQYVDPRDDNKGPDGLTPSQREEQLKAKGALGA